MEIELEKSTGKFLVRRKRESTDTLENRIKKFTEFFVDRFIKKLASYKEEVLGCTTKAGKFANLVGPAGQAVGSAIGALADIRGLGGPVGGGTNTLFGFLGRREHKKKAKNIYTLIGNLLGEEVSEELVNKLIDIGNEIFQNFEYQFKDVLTNDSNHSWDRAMSKLAQDAVDRVMNYLNSNFFEVSKEQTLESLPEIIFKGIINGKSKEGFALTLTPRLLQGITIPVINKKLPQLGHTLKNDQEEWKTSEIYEKPGLIKLKNQFYNKDGSKPEKYGFRIAFPFEEKEIGDRIDEPGKVNEDAYNYKYEVIKKSKPELEDLKRAVCIELGQKVLYHELGKWWPREEKLPNSFVERKDKDKLIAEKLHDILTSNTKAAVKQKASITGLGGIGKTTTAKWYANKYEDQYDHIFWIDSDGHEATKKFKELAERLDIEIVLPDKESKNIKVIAGEIYAKLEQRYKNKCLFIFDNADKYERDLLPEHENFYTLITSRNKNWGTEQGYGKIQQLELGLFSEQESINFIRGENALGNSASEEDAKALAKELGYLPLALQQSVACMKENELTEIKDYIDRYKAEYITKKDSILATGNLDDYEEKVLTTWLVTLKKIQNNPSGELAIKIFNIMAYLSPNNINQEMLSEFSENKFQFTNAIKLLKSYAMINKQDEQIEVHRVVQKVTRIELKEDKKEEETLRECLELTQKNLNEKIVDHAMSAWHYGSKYDGLVKEFSKLPYGIIDELDNAIRYNEAIKFGKEAIDKLKEILGENHPSTLSAMNNLALTLDKQGENEEALKLFKRVVDNMQETNHPDSLDAMNNLAVALDNQGEYEEAFQLYKQIVDKRKKILGEKHALDTMNDLALTLYNKGEYEEALKIYKQVIDKSKKILGENHLDTLSAMNNLALTLDNTGEHEKALKLYKQVVNKMQKILGENNHYTLTAMNNLALTLDKKGEYEEALKLYRHVIDKSKEILGENHPDTLDAMNNLANVLYKKREYEEAFKLFKHVLDKREEILGESHPSTLSAMNNLALTLDKKREYDEAFKLFSQILDKRKEIFIENHPSILDAMNNLANTLANKGEYKEALKLYKNVIDKRKETLGENHPDTLSAIYNLASTLANKEEYEEAFKFYKHVVDERKEILGENHPDTLSAMYNLAITLANKGKYEEALKLYNQVAEKMKEINHPDTLISMNHLAYVLFKTGKYNEALKLFNNDVLARDDHDTVLHKVVSSANNEAIRFILDKIKEKDPDGIHNHVNAKDAEGDTSLMWAAVEGNIDAASLLLEYGADINEIDHEGQTALHEAAMHNHPDFVQFLLSKGANPNIKDINGKNAFNLAQERLNQDPENEELKTITGLLLSVIQQDQLSECLQQRKKRNTEADCLFSWEDIDEFNEEETRDEIAINSAKFINYIKTTSEAKRDQLIQFADTVPIIGNNKETVRTLIKNQKILNYLNRVEKVSSITMHGMMLKSAISDLLNGNYEGVAINLGFIAGSPILSKISEAASIKGAELVSNGKFLVGQSLKLASPFLARSTSAFVAYDLVNQVKAYEGGNKDALVGVVGDGIYIGVDVAEIGIEVAEAFSILEGVSSVTGPIGSAIGMLIFVGTDIYMAVKTVDKIDKIVHLTGGEKFIEGIRAFFGMQPEKKLEEVVEKIEVNNQLVKEGIEFLKQHKDIKIYVFPTVKSVIDSCRTIESKQIEAAGHLGSIRTVVKKKRTECKTKFEPDLDNQILLDRKRTNIKLSRSKPDKPSEGELFCLPQGDDVTVPSNGAYLCENAIGIEYPNNRTGNYTFINIGDGNDYVKGLKDSSNIFLVGNGFKTLFGNNGNDTFILKGNVIQGIIEGKEGINNIDLTTFVPEETSVSVDLNKGSLAINDNNSIELIRINKVKGREGKQDIITTACDSLDIDGNGGGDVINIEGSCPYDIRIAVRSNDVINNNGSAGKFNYIILADKGEARINVNAHGAKHNFFFNHALSDIKEVNIQKALEYQEIHYTLRRINFSFDSGNVVVANIPQNASFILSDNTEIKIGEKNIYAIQKTSLPVSEIIKTYPEIANRLKMTIVAQSSDETIVVGHGHHDVLHNDPKHKTHLIGNGGENIFVLTSESLPIPDVIIYDSDQENKIDTLDLRDLKEKIASTFGDKIDDQSKFTITADSKDIIIVWQFHLLDIIQNVIQITLKDALVTNWHERLHIITDKVPMKIQGFELKPLPLEFTDKDTKIIVIGPDDVESEHKIIVSRPIGNYELSRLNNDLIITNAFVTDLDNAISITLKDFYVNQKMQTLSIKFADKDINVKDKLKDKLDNVKLFEEQLNQYKYNSSILSPSQTEEKTLIHRTKRYATSGAIGLSSWMNTVANAVTQSFSSLTSGLTFSLTSKLTGYFSTKSDSVCDSICSHESSSSQGFQHKSRTAITQNFDLNRTLLPKFPDLWALYILIELV